MLGAFIILMASNWQEYKIKMTPLNVTVVLFFFSFGISTFVGVDWYKSFWDNHERMLGLFTIFHYIIYYFVVASVAKEWKDWRMLLRIFLFAGSIVMLIGVWQKFVDPQFFLNRGDSRVSATLGNPIYYSGYGLFLMFIGYLLAVKEKKYNFWQWYAVAGGFLGFLGIFLGGTRGALLGLVSGLGILFVSYIISLKGHKKIRQSLAGLVLLGVILIGVLFAFRQVNFVKNIPAVGGLLNISITSGTGETRLMAWDIAIKAWREKPVFGWGPNNYYYAFNKYYRPEFLEHGWSETWFDNAHSIVMNTLAVQGTVGILTLFSIFGVGIFILLHSFRKRYIDVHIMSVGLAFLVAHLISRALVFEDPTSYLYFFFILAFINSLTSRGQQESDIPTKKVSNASPSWGLVGLVGIVVVFFIYTTNVNPARANMANLIAIRRFQNFDDMIMLFERVQKIPSPHIDDIRTDFVRTTLDIIPQIINSGRQAEALKLFEVAYAQNQKNRLLHPMDIQVNIRQAQLALMAAQMKQDVQLLYTAEQVLEEALAYSPKRQQLQYMLVGIKLQLNKPLEAVSLLENSIEDDYKITEGWWRLAGVYQNMGDNKKAREVILEAQSRGIKFTGQAETTVNQILRFTSTEATDDTAS